MQDRSAEDDDDHGRSGRTKLWRGWAWIIDQAISDRGSLVLVLLGVVGILLVLVHPPTTGNLALYASYGLVILIDLTLRGAGSGKKVERLEARAEKIEKDMRSVAASTSDISTTTGRLLEQGSFLVQEAQPPPEFMANAMSIRVSGVTLNRTLEANSENIRGTLRQGGSVDILLTEYHEHLAREFPWRFIRVRHNDGESIEDVEDPVDRLAWRLQGAEISIGDLVAHRDDLTGTLRVGLVPFIMPCGIISVQRGEGLHSLRVEIYHRHSTRGQGQTAFYLTGANHDHRRWLEFFSRSFDDYWEVAVHHSKVITLLDRGILRGPLTIVPQGNHHG